MNVLRGIQPVIKVTAVFVLVFTTASTLTLLNPQATHAEGYLFGKVRCLVRTVLLTECPSTTAPTPAPAPSNTPAPQPSSQPSSGSSVQPSAPTDRGGKGPVSPAVVTPLEAPEVLGDEHAPIQKLQSIGTTQGDRMSESEYIAYFNAYSPYAVAGQPTANEAAIVQAGPEGWRILGIAWYWWAMALALCVAIFASVKRIIFRRSSVL